MDIDGPPDAGAAAGVGAAAVAGAVSWVHRVERHDRIGSTNARALQAAAEGAEAGLVVVAGAQTAGRGRRDRTWVAPPGSSLLVSVLLRPTLPMRLWPLLPLVAGIALHDTVQSVLRGADDDSRAAHEVGLKWPNDLLVGGVKAAGILVESSGDAVIVGIGLNLDWRGIDRPAGLVLTSLAEAGADGDGIARDAVLVRLLTDLGVRLAEAEVDPSGVVPTYIPRCCTLGMTVEARGVPGARGVAVGLTPDGHLRIRRPSGEETTVSAGEVEHLR